MINPTETPDQDPAAATQIIRFNSKPEHAFAIADLTPAYARNARRVWRGIALLDRNKALVHDEIQANKPIDLWWFMHTPASISIESDGRAANLEQVGAQLRAVILSPPEAKFQIRDAQPLPASPHPEGQAKNERVRKLAIYLTGINDSRLAVLLVPNPSKAEEAGEAIKLSPLSEW